MTTRLLAASLLVAAVSGCAAAPTAATRRAADEGYVLGASDAVKQLYWAKQALEAPRGGAPAGRLEYYTWEEAGRAQDGTKLAPEKVAVPVFIPAPAPSGSSPP